MKEDIERACAEEDVRVFEAIVNFLAKREQIPTILPSEEDNVVYVCIRHVDDENVQSPLWVGRCDYDSPNCNLELVKTLSEYIKKVLDKYMIIKESYNEFGIPQVDEVEFLDSEEMIMLGDR